MRLRNYILNEEIVDDAEDIVDILNEDCKPILNVLKKYDYKYFLYRGSRSIADNFQKITPRKNRKPLNTPIKLHNILDKMFQKKFGWKARSEGVFAAGQLYPLDEYGPSYLFFPIGNFKYVWSPEIEDLYEEFDIDTLNWFKGSGYKSDILYQYYNDYMADNVTVDVEDLLTFEQWVEKNIDGLEKDFIEIVENKLNSYTNKGLDKVLKIGTIEIMFKCKDYYMVDTEFWFGIQNLLKRG